MIVGMDAIRTKVRVIITARSSANPSTPEFTVDMPMGPFDPVAMVKEAAAKYVAEHRAKYVIGILTDKVRLSYTQIGFHEFEVGIVANPAAAEKYVGRVQFVNRGQPILLEEFHVQMRIA